MQSFKAYLNQKGLRSASIVTYKKAVDRFRDWLVTENLPAPEVSYADLLAWIQVLRETNLHAKTINVKLGAIRHYYAYLIETNQAKNNPAQGLVLKGVSKSRVHNLLNELHLQAIYTSYQPEWPEQSERDKLAGYRNQVMLSLLIEQGLLRRELEGLKLVDLQAGKLHVPATSGTNSRTLPLQAYQVGLLTYYIQEIRREILKRNGTASDRLLLGIEGGISLKNPLAALIKKLKRAHPDPSIGLGADLKNALQLRQSRIRLWLEKYDLRTVQYMAGHRYISSTEKYAFEDMKNLQKQLSKYHPLG